MLHFVRVVPFSCCTFLCVALLSCCTFARFASCCTLYVLLFLGIQVRNFIKKRFHHRCFPVKFVTFLRPPILKNICERLLLKLFSKTVSISKSHNIIYYSLLRQKQSFRCVLYKKGALRNFVKFTGKHVCQGLFFIKLQASSLKPATLLEKRLWHRCFLVNFTKLLRTPFYTEHLWWLLPSDFSLSRIQIYFNLLFKKTLAGPSKHLK